MWFKAVCVCLKLVTRKPKFRFLGKAFDPADEPFLLLSNHVGAKGPLLLELYLDLPFRFWGSHEITEGTRSVYRYLADVYFHQKIHLSKGLSKFIAFFVCPFMNVFCKGIRLIPTFTDARFKRTISKSVAVMQGGQNLVIFPEDSSDGYHDVLTSFLPGFAYLANTLLKKGQDVLIYCAYYRKKERTFVVDAPIRFSELCGERFDKLQLAKRMCDKTNGLASD